MITLNGTTARTEKQWSEVWRVSHTERNVCTAKRARTRKPKSSEQAWQEAEAANAAGADLMSAMRGERGWRVEAARDAAAGALIKGAAKQRCKTGQSITVLMLVLAVFVVAPLGLLAFEMSRYALAKQQLKACVEAAALAAAATTATSNTLSALETQNIAMATALNMYKQESILDKALTGTTQSGSLPLNPGPNQSIVYFQFLDPVTRLPVPLGSANGKVIQVTGAFGIIPMFARFLGLGQAYVAQETSNGGLPMLDVILCFDISGSMDDFSPITAVYRYRLNANSNGYRTVCKGPLYTAFQATRPTGTPVNATFPQELETSNVNGSGVWIFDRSVTTGRGTNHNSAAPANAPVNGRFTDLVVNIDGTDTFNAGIVVTYNNTPYNFPANNIGCLVEASRGNLESTTIATNAHVPYSSWGITPKAGYYQAYLQAARANRHPITDAITAATNFFTIMNNSCDAHFGIVTFSSRPGSSSTSTVPPDYGSGLGHITDNPGSYRSNNYPVDSLSTSASPPNYPYYPPNPTIKLNPTLGAAYSNYSTITNSIQYLLSYGGTDIAGSLNAAIRQMKPASSGGEGLSRSGSMKAIVLFTDGLPTSSSLGGGALADTRSQAAAARQAGIPIYCIGLCMVPSLQASQYAILNHTNSDPSTGGVAGISSNGAIFYQVTSGSELSRVFGNLARNLVRLVK